MQNDLRDDLEASLPAEVRRSPSEGMSQDEKLAYASTLALDTIIARLESAEPPPDHVLAKLVSELNKIVDRTEDEPVVEDVSVLEMIPRLPASHARRLVDQEVGRCRAEIRRLEAALEQLEGA